MPNSALAYFTPASAPSRHHVIVEGRYGTVANTKHTNSLVRWHDSYESAMTYYERLGWQVTEIVDQFTRYGRKFEACYCESCMRTPVPQSQQRVSH